MLVQSVNQTDFTKCLPESFDYVREMNPCEKLLMLPVLHAVPNTLIERT